jgi:hypothetical protein
MHALQPLPARFFIGKTSALQIPGRPFQKKKCLKAG